jgi:Fic/DOC family
METSGLRLAPSTALKEKRLAALLAGRDAAGLGLAGAVANAQLLGSLDLAGFAFTWEQVKAARRGEPGPAPLLGLLRAQGLFEPTAPFGVAALGAWHAAAVGAPSTFRTAERPRVDAPPGAPPGFIAGRLSILEEWLGGESGRELKPVQQGALVLARVVEILPWDDANGRVARLAASHLMVRGGMRPPILVAGDRPRLEKALQAAFQLHTEPLATLLEEASERSLDVMIRVLESPESA